MSTKSKVIDRKDALAAASVLDAVVRGLPMPTNIDKGAVQNVADALLSAFLEERDATSIAIVEK